MPPPPSPLRILLSLFFVFLYLAVSAAAPLTLPLRRVSLPHPPTSAHANLEDEAFHSMATLAFASSLRASLLKDPLRRRSVPSPSSSPLFPHSYGGYSLTLSFGTPPQPLSLLLDTGSHLSWLSCTSSYQCRSCSSPSAVFIRPFLPKSSSSARLVGCKNPKCLWIHDPDLLSRCRDCARLNSTDCPTICPPYALIYGSGSTAGLLLSETLSFPNRTVADFAVGCSVFSDHQPAGGIAAFGLGAPSIPFQLGLKRFSYCLISRRYDDDNAESGSLVLDPAKEDSSNGVRFTPFLRNPAASSEGSPFSVYYYVGLRKITVGGEKVTVPYSVLVPGPDGDGGAIIDSGTTFTYMALSVFEPIVAAFVDRVADRYKRSASVEERTGLRPCFQLPTGAAEVELPELVFHFKGGAEMRLPLENYFVFVGSARDTVCLTVVSDGGAAPAGINGGPSIILGNFQQQNYYIMYDLERDRLGFRRQSCLRM